jgi:cell division protein FtsI (penicillin-binding protein 3)
LRKQSLGRLLFLKIGLLLFFLVVALRLVQVQVIDSSGYKEIARRQYEVKVSIPATRGNIYDRNGKILASNTMFVSFGADPKIVGDDAAAIAERFARVFGKSKASYLEKLTTTNTRFVWLERRVSPEFSKKINASEFEGIIQLDEPQRIYHHDYVAGQLIGFTDVDNNGLSGIELQFNDQLKGADGYVIMQRDGLGRKRPSVDYPRAEPVNGRSIVLTLDLDYQSIAEEQLRKGIERNKAESGLVVMLDPASSEILAMANYPSINLNNMRGVSQAEMKNRTITDMFEPGSVFKIVTVSAALEHHLVRPEQKFFAENGTYIVPLPGGKTRKITDTHEHGMLTFQEGMEQSSNIVMAKVSDIIGTELLYRMARDFGFGTSTGIELPGEVNGELKKPTQWSGTTLNTMAYGYEVAITPLQLAAAYGAVANNGVLMRPYVVRQIRNEHNEVVSDGQQQIVRRVISKSTAEQLKQFLVGVVERGTGTSAKLEDIPIAGKTGTSRKYIDGKYEMGNYTASFAGLIPADDPKLVCLVMLDNPHAAGYTGGLASAPIFKGIAERVVAVSERFTRKSNTVIADNQLLAVPDVLSLKNEVAVAMLEDQGFDVETYGKGKMVQGQSPSPGTKLPRGSKLKLATDEAVPGSLNGTTLVPDVKGLTIRRAINRMTMQHLDVDVNGSGIVVSQSSSPGQQVRVGTRITLRCVPRSLSMVSLY